ncbi:MAG: regulator of chromosome condensation [Myxococcaceae bacterium]|nr:regulator of chromosome condensation [Myxococcaceae bacterium]
MVRSLPVWLFAALLAAPFGCGQPKKLIPVVDSGTPLPTETCFDNDGDGIPGTGDCTEEPVRDCNDSDPKVKPGAVEICDRIDNNCDSIIDEGLTTSSYYKDADGDSIGSAEKTGEGCSAPPAGSVTSTGDCNDADKNVRPGVAETCNGIDDDCDGVKDNGLPFQDFYLDGDGDGFGNSTGTPVSSCQLNEQGRVANKGDCNDTNPTVKPGIAELCNKVDDNCDGQVDNGITFQSYYPDVDGDSFGSDGAGPESSCAPVAGKVTNNADCNDTVPTVKPGAPEACNAVDDNCNNQIDEGLSFASYYPDADGDGFGKTGTTAQSSCIPVAGKVTNNTDCNDLNPTVKPGAAELCNGVDDNCSGAADEGLTFQSYFVDGDGDGFGAGTGTSSCTPIAGRVTNNTDCNDTSASIKPSATEICNGVDDNCNVQIDEGLTFADYWPDSDGDTYGNKNATPINSCVVIATRVTNNGDCNDALFAVKPGAAEVCNGVDDNCNLSTDEGLTFTNYYPDTDGDTYGSSTAPVQSACAPVAGKVTGNTDCNDALFSVHPGAAEACNSIDDNCDGLVDNGTTTQNYYPDVDGDGYGAVSGTPINSCNPVAGRVTNNSDCNDSATAVHPGAPEVCNGVDDNCVGGIDNGLTFLSYYPDLDGDGFGSASAAAQSACAPVAGKLTSNSDCNDSNAAIKPGATEVCNGADDNCAGGIDEGLPTTNYYTDGDGDGFGATAAAAQASCGPVSGKVPNNTDCNDANANVRPTASETCNGIDDNCGGGIDEGNPGGGGACSTGQSGVCAAGTLTCTSGSVTCVRNTAPSAEKCNGLDDNCSGAADETFPTKGQACSAGLGVCLRSGTNVCTADQLGVVCSVVAGAPTAMACDGLDNDCDGVVDEPSLSSTAEVTAPTAWADVEVEPYYYSAASCAGGVNGAGTDALAGGGMAMSGGVNGFYFQPLTSAGAPTGVAPVAAASGLNYSDVDLAQAGDGFLMAGIYLSGTEGYEIDLYYMDAVTGAKRTYLWGQGRRTGTNTLDSLRVVRGNGKRVTLIWRETSVGIKTARFEPCYNTTTSAWEIKGAGCGALPVPTLFPNTATYPAGLGADSTHEDWVASQSCPTAASLRKMGIAWLTTPTSLNYFTVNEDGSGKSGETVVRTVTSPVTMEEPELVFFRSASADQFFVADVMHDPGTTPRSDFEFWLTTDPGYHWAYLSYATLNGANSILRPRASATATQILMSAVRYDVDPTGTTFTRQVMTRRSDFLGVKSPSSSAVEISATTGSCTSQPASCRPGNKDGLTNWAAVNRLYYSASGASPAGTFSSVLTCN